MLFFYDESNNPRKIWLKQDSFNAPIDKNFILGGVMHFGKQDSTSIDELKSKLKLQKNAKELKFKHLSKQTNFTKCLSSPRLNIFLQWLKESNLYIHFSNFNNLYWAIMDIVDTDELSKKYDEIALGGIKNELYKIAKKNYAEFYKLLFENNYPNIPKENIYSFYQNIIDIIDASPIVERSFNLELLRQTLKSSREQKELLLLQENSPMTVVENYFIEYIRPLGVFPYANHTFDNEHNIEKEFNRAELLYEGKPFNNFSFEDSQRNPFIQVSDCVVGLLAKFFNFVNASTTKKVEALFSNSSSIEKSNLKLLSEIINISEEYSPLLRHSVSDVSSQLLTTVILENAMNL